jgi:hypothetical protein
MIGGVKRPHSHNKGSATSKKKKIGLAIELPIPGKIAFLVDRFTLLSYYLPERTQLH